MTSIQEIAIIGTQEMKSGERRDFELDHHITTEELPIIWGLIDLLHERSDCSDKMVVERSGNDWEISITIP
jgi:hypothetical protein